MKKIFSREFWNEQDVEQYIGMLLRYGVMLACTITSLGGIVYLTQQQGVMPNYNAVPSGEWFGGVAQYLREPNTIWSHVLQFDGAAIIQLGVMVLIATPILRVCFSALSFLIEKDYMYVAITCIVLAIIVSNMLLGFH
ncbi:MAG: hypothetical protein RL662_1230 [Bacteroidota bacterium]|jgi:uncharacterized membrane protein